MNTHRNRTRVCRPLLVSGALLLWLVWLVQLEAHSPEIIRANQIQRVFTDTQARRIVTDVEFLGEVTFDTGFSYGGTELGGLSALTYDPDNQIYYGLSDDSSEDDARFYELTINVGDGNLQAGDINLKDVVTLHNTSGNPFAPGGIDPEGMALTADGTLYISSEKDANGDPFISEFRLTGEQVDSLPVPSKFVPTATMGVRDNFAFESLTMTPNDEYLYVANAQALVQDGPVADPDTETLVRFITYDLTTQQPGAEYVYVVDPVAEISDPVDGFSSNSLVELLALDNTGTFLALERSYAVGKGNTVRLYQAFAQDARDVSGEDDIFQETGSVPFNIDPTVTKELLVNLQDTGITPDNLEGMAFGPQLNDGRQTLILVSDNNFNDTQVTQFLAFALTIDETPIVSSTVPVDSATDIAVDADLEITFSENVNVTNNSFSITCSQSGSVASTVSGGPQTYTISPTTTFADGEECTVTILATEVTDNDGTTDEMFQNEEFSFTTAGVAFVCSNPATLISQVQGDGTTSPELNTTVTIEGIVIADYQASGEMGGYFVQEEDTDADANDRTSEGIYVTADTGTAVSVGDQVRIKGTVRDDSSAPSYGQTVLQESDVRVCSTGNTLPTAARVELPFSSATDAERYEGMLVVFPQNLTVTGNYHLGRFGELLLSSGGRLFSPTQIAAPGTAASKQETANVLNQIILDDRKDGEGPNPIPYLDRSGTNSDDITRRNGATVTGLQGVLSYGSSAYRIRPLAASPPNLIDANPRPVTPADVGGDITVASFNVHNFFNGDGAGGGFPTSRGADNVTELARQKAKIVAALLAMDADIVGLMEIENDYDAIPTELSAMEELVDALNAEAGAVTYAFINPGNSTIGSDAIAVGLIYQSATVTPVGSYAILDSSTAPAGEVFDDTKNRPTLAQTFAERATGERFTVAVTHLTSKDSPCGAGDDNAQQGNCNGIRTDAASALAAWLATDPTSSGDRDALIIGDLNAYAQEDPLVELETNGYTNLARSFGGPTAYSYVFFGEAGTLDYALANASLTPAVTGATAWHSNTDEPRVIDYTQEVHGSTRKPEDLYAAGPFRSSDHDPLIVGLTLDPASTALVQYYLPLVRR